MEQTLEQRCKVALECLPDARYRTMLASLFEELLAAVLAVQREDPPRVTVLLPDGDRRDVDVALVDWTATGELQVCITVGDVQHNITDMLVAHRDMIEAQQRGDGEAEVLAVRRMEAARSAIDSAASGNRCTTGVQEVPRG